MNNNEKNAFDPLVKSGQWELDSDLIELCKRNNMTDDFARVIQTVQKYGPLPRHALRELFPNGFSNSIKKAKKINAVFIKNGCVGYYNGNLNFERIIDDNLVMQRLFAALSELNKSSKIAYFDFGNDMNELIFVTKGNIFKLVLVRAGEEEFLSERYNQKELDSTEIVRYIPIVTTYEQIRKLHINDTFIYCKMAYVPNAWSVEWIGADQDV